MDALDAGAYAYVFEAKVPRALKVVLWGPLHAKQLGFEEWTYQDGGETGFVYHTSGRAVKMGLATATLIVVRRIEKAFLTVYLGGYPTDAAPAQRRLECRSLLNEAELLLTRLAHEPIKFRETAEHTLVDNVGPTPEARAPSPDRTLGRRAAKGIIEA